MTFAIRTDKLSKHYGQRIAVDQLTLEVPQGAVFGLLGPNGAGKTTTIGMLLGLVRPTSGEAEVLGHNVRQNLSAVLSQVGAMIEAPAFYPYLSGRDNLLVLAHAAGLSAASVDRSLELVDLHTRAKDRFKIYSQGMKQRLAIAAALLHQPTLIILDEPTNGLDPAGQHEIRTLVQSLAAQDHTVMLCSHILSEVEQVCHQVAILKQGQLIAAGAVAELLHRGQRLHIRVSTEPTQAATLLKALDWVGAVTYQGDTLLVEAPVERAADLNTLLVGAGVAVREIVAYEERLEDLFLELTRTSVEAEK
jgi:ABC-2 type transport system ATP-binding protein